MSNAGSPKRGCYCNLRRRVDGTILGIRRLRNPLVAVPAVAPVVGGGSNLNGFPSRGGCCVSLSGGGQVGWPEPRGKGARASPRKRSCRRAHPRKTPAPKPTHRFDAPLWQNASGSTLFGTPWWVVVPNRPSAGTIFKGVAMTMAALPHWTGGAICQHPFRSPIERRCVSS
jgi:hypothetical protein